MHGVLVNDSNDLSSSYSYYTSALAEILRLSTEQLTVLRVEIMSSLIMISLSESKNIVVKQVIFIEQRPSFQMVVGNFRPSSEAPET